MNKQAAQKLVQETLQDSFDKERFVYLVKNILNHVEEDHKRPYAGSYVFADYRDSIQSLDRVGKYQSPDEKLIDILIVHLAKDTSLDRARTKQRNFVAKYLKGSRGGVLKDAALVAFVAPSGEDWRFSLVKMEYKFNEKGKVEEEFTPARRYSFLVGKNENSHTAQSRLLPVLLNDEVSPTLEELEETFSVERVTKEFFEKYRDLFLRIKESLDAVVKKDAKVRADFKEKNIDTVDFAKKLLGQIVFLYFLQKKGWFGVARGKEWGSGSKHFLRELFEKKHGNYKNFFNDILEPLFYEALRLERSGDYYSRFNCRIPFLNGGLFDPLGDYDWWKTDILLPKDIFSNDRKTKEGDIGDGVLDIFDRYNFTVKEDEPLEKEVAVDPEMLGKVFENLLEVKDRKSKGTYYTPREIVHYMCQESLANYLATELAVSAEASPARHSLGAGGAKAEGQVTKEDIEKLIKYGETSVEHDAVYVEKKSQDVNYRGRYERAKLPKTIERHAKLIDEKLAAIRVCDPAVGSGAFPVGMMNEIVRTRNALTPHINGDLSAEALAKAERTPYHFKRQAIQNCLYGVDIDPGAVEIAKLRLWLSLVVDEEEREQIQPLPNLDYKIVQGNSLLSVEKNLFNAAQFSKLEELKPLYFNETSASKKREYRKQIDELIGQITNGHKDFDFEVYFSEVFHEKKGFDVVIANPPYVEHKKLKSISPLLKRFKVYSGTADLYVYFYEVALNILREAGILTFISSNKFIRARYGSPLRGMLAKNRVHNIVDFTEVKVFDALVASCIILVSKNKPGADVVVTFADDTFTNNLADYIANNHIKVPADTLSDVIWQLEDKTKLKVKQRIEANTEKLGSADGVKIFRGVTTGYNPAFIIDEKKRKEFISRDGSNKEVIKPLLQGRNIKKWGYKTTHEYLLFIPWHFPLHQDSNISGASEKAENSFKNDYPDIYRHVSKFKDDLAQRNKEETGIRYEWYALQRCAASYYPEFEKEKIIWGLTADKWAFAYDNKGHYLPSNGYILTSSSLTVKYLLALLNSRLMQFYFGFVGIMTAGGAYTLKHETITSLPIKKLSTSEQKPFIDLVDKILAITKDDDYLENTAKQAKVREYERQIDQLVYKLYGLTSDEIKIVEESK